MIIHLKKNNKSGFSLVEILAVLMIIGILALVSLPIYIKIKPLLNLNAETRDVASDLRYAQQLAVTEQNNYSIIFDKNSNSYSIVNDTSGQIIKDKEIINSITIDSITNLTSDTVTFNVTGASSESGDITLINVNNVTSTISIKPSGYVKIE